MGIKLRDHPNLIASLISVLDDPVQGFHGAGILRNLCAYAEVDYIELRQRHRRWSLIAWRFPGRTINGIKKYWNTHIERKLLSKGLDHQTHRPLGKLNNTRVSLLAPNHEIPAFQNPTTLEITYLFQHH